MAEKEGRTNEHNKSSALLAKRKRSYTPKLDLLPLKSYGDLSQYEVDRVKSALEVTSRMGEPTKRRRHVHEGLQTKKGFMAIKKEHLKAKPKEEKSARTIRSTKKNVQILEALKTKKYTSEIRKHVKIQKMQDIKTAENVRNPKKKNSLPCKTEQNDLPEEECDVKTQEAGTSQDKTSVDKKKIRRLKTALKLLDFVEGKYDSSDSDWSMGSVSLSSECLDAASEGGKRSTQRLQAQHDLSPRDYFGFCRDCRSRCRNCGRRRSAVAMEKNRKDRN
ncbi:uncharacterized protein LOC119547531 [Drosophila subpulchrella]|uniref:uncharacterized protein LOC119547531 n=1 Tax=Drosophila subpulchrella TaxID=1486046 RepID=UPI0018A12A7C|nr:uncharacterized protein LOC119547531 [Drosophila subpulchrella]